MKLAISNIGWSTVNDSSIYSFMNKYGYSGLEIAPTRIFAETPYDKINEAMQWRDQLNKEYGFAIPSMQSIWFGRQERLFGTAEERKILINYTKKAIDFAAAICCTNLVFGCPQNRNKPQNAVLQHAIDFFREIGEYALNRGTTIGIEANPPIYQTNFLNDTTAVLELVKQINCRGILINLDVGTMIQNEEDVSELVGNVSLINHVHISEPYLNPIKQRTLHKELRHILDGENYNGYISIEMGRQEKLAVIEEKMIYVRTVWDE